MHPCRSALLTVDTRAFFAESHKRRQRHKNPTDKNCLFDNSGEHRSASQNKEWNGNLFTGSRNRGIVYLVVHRLAPLVVSTDLHDSARRVSTCAHPTARNDD